MTYFLDTNVCIHYERNVSLELYYKVMKNIDNIKIPSMVAAEFMLGAEKSAKRGTTLKYCRDFLEQFEIVGFDKSAAFLYAELRATLERRGLLIGANDMVIASTVLAHRGILVTNNIREFERIENLQIEDWL
ncbi:MAG: type II toxin-antitoxin system VapC family toxin [Oscillospiraceae bacterium]|nr:type II toxin-antitoxin system VapC family toxin [Oscillospiraceae bacterium]